MSNFGTMRDRIADEAAAEGLTDQIEREIQSAINHYQTRRFHFNQGTLTFTTVENQVAYGESDNSNIPYIADIQAAKVYPVSWATPITLVNYSDIFTTVSQITGGIPEWISYRDFTVYLAPSPIEGYSVEIAYLKRLDALSADTDTNDWMTYGEELIRQRAKRMLFGNVLHNYPAAEWSKSAEFDALDVLIKLEMKLSHGAPARLPDITGRGGYNIYGDQ